MKRIGIFAGTFDPIHEGHLQVGKKAIKELGLNSVYFMIEEDPWGSKKPVSINHRRKMLEIAITEDKEPKNLKILEVENKRFDIKSTLRIVENKFETSELYFIFGADVFMNMNVDTWQDLKDLLKHYIVVFERGHTAENEISKHAKSLGIVTAIIPSLHPHHSSSAVRLKPHNKEILVPKRVVEYINSNNLY